MRSFLILLAFAFAPAALGQPRSIDVFFDEFTAEWVRSNPNLATAVRCFSGEEQAKLERQTTPDARLARKDMIQRRAPRWATSSRCASFTTSFSVRAPCCSSARSIAT